LVYANAPTLDLWEYVGTDGRVGRVQVRTRVKANNGDGRRQGAEDGHGIVMGTTFIVYRTS
jgi:hypothetical protein